MFALVSPELVAMELVLNSHKFPGHAHHKAHMLLPFASPAPDLWQSFARIDRHVDPKEDVKLCVGILIEGQILVSAVGVNDGKILCPAHRVTSHRESLQTSEVIRKLSAAR